jgi:hypothetical protein
MNLKDKYILARCCNPTTADKIRGYYSHDNIIKVHQDGCHNLMKAEAQRLVRLSWKDILDEKPFHPGKDYKNLDNIDFKILNHHRHLGLDYSLKVARVCLIDKETVFERHNKLRDLGLLERVEPRMIRYRKNIVKGKWIKHRNHTYYDLTVKGNQYLDYYLKSGQ